MADEKRTWPTLTLTVNGSTYRAESEALEGRIGGARVFGRWNDKGGLDLEITFPGDGIVAQGARLGS